jgi:hypothetical protein
MQSGLAYLSQQPVAVALLLSTATINAKSRNKQAAFKPMSLALPPGCKGPRSMRCIECDGPDPLQRPDILNLVNTLGRKG